MYEEFSFEETKKKRIPACNPLICSIKIIVAMTILR